MCCLLLQIALFAVQSTEIPAVNISSVFQHCLESFLEWGGAGHMKMHSYIYFSRYFSLFIVAMLQCEILENRTRGLLETVETGNLRVDNIFILLFFLCFFFFFFSAAPRAHEDFQARELYPLAYATAKATPDPSHVCDLHHSKHEILNPSEARD